MPSALLITRRNRKRFVFARGGKPIRVRLGFFVFSYPGIDLSHNWFVSCVGEIERIAVSNNFHGLAS